MWSNTNSYHVDFPVEQELGVGGATLMLQADGTVNPHKELAFVGYTYKRWETLRIDL